MADLGEVSRTLNYHQQRRLGRIQTLIVHVIVPRARRTRLPLLLYTRTERRFGRQNRYKNRENTTVVQQPSTTTPRADRDAESGERQLDPRTHQSILSRSCFLGARGGSRRGAKGIRTAGQGLPQVPNMDNWAAFGICRLRTGLGMSRQRRVRVPTGLDVGRKRGQGPHTQGSGGTH